MRLRHIAVVSALLLSTAACGGSDDTDASATTEAAQSDGDDTTTTAATSTDAQILGEDTVFAPGGDGAADLTAEVAERECELGEVLFGSCRASTGAGGPFLVTAEGDVDAPGEWNVVVRCGLDPATPVASAKGTFQPATADLGLAPYGEVLGVSLTTGDEAEGALVYQPEGSDCPVVWGLGPIGPSNVFVGGTDRLNGDEAPIRFTQADGSPACAVADGDGGIEVTPASVEGCVG
jgi:hypothetical protein